MPPAESLQQLILQQQVGNTSAGNNCTCLNQHLICSALLIELFSRLASIQVMQSQLLSLGGNIDGAALQRTREKLPEDSAEFQARIIQLEGQVELQHDIRLCAFPTCPS